MDRVRWQIDQEGRIITWNQAAEEYFARSKEAVLGQPCASVIQGADAFGRALCERCPVQREIRHGAYQASTPLTHSGKRMLCQAYAGQTVRVELRPERGDDPGEVLASLSWAVRKLTTEPKSFFQTLQVFLSSLRHSLGMEAAELFLSDPQERYLVLTAYDGVHREAFLEKPWFAWGEGFPGVVSLEHHPLVTHDLPSDTRYLRQKVKKLGYKTYVCYPLELPFGERAKLHPEGDRPQGLIGVLNLASRDPEVDDQELLEQLGLVGPMLASSLYTVLTRLSEQGLISVISAIRAHQESQGIEAFLAQSAALSGASAIQLTLNDGQSYSYGPAQPAPCAHGQACAVWQGHILGVRSGTESCPHICSGQPRQCLPLWSGGKVIGLQQLFFARLPQPVSQAVAPVLWQERLGAELLWPHQKSQENPKALPEGDSHQEGPHGELLEISTFGGLRIKHKGEILPPKAFVRRQTLRLFKLLLAHRGQTLSREELCECLWPGEDTRETQNRLHVLVHDLRQVLEPDPGQPQIILREGDGYRFAPQISYSLDVELFDKLVHHGDCLEGTAALEAYRQALALYKGDFLADEQYADWAELERSYLRERAVGALFRTAEIALSLNQRREALEAYWHILKLDPWREEAYRALILHLMNSGQEPEARSLFSQYRVRMEREGLPVDSDLAQLVRVSV